MRIRSAHDLAGAVRGRRKDLAMSQAELARRAGIARKSVIELESGRTQPELRLMLRILEQLGLAIEIHPPTKTRTSKPTVDLDAVIRAHRRR